MFLHDFREPQVIGLAHPQLITSACGLGNKFVGSLSQLALDSLKSHKNLDLLL